MAFMLTRFEVELLHGRRTIKIPIEDNKLILVGENGSGKTTIISLLYFFLSRQWSRLQPYNFKSLTVTLNNQVLCVSQEDLRSARLSPDALKRLRRFRFSDPRMSEKLNDVLMTLILEKPILDKRRIWQLQQEFGISESLLFELLSSFDQAQLPFAESEKLGQVDAVLKNEMKGIVLYLPTYRRIEQDLKNIFPSSDVEKLIEQMEEAARPTNRSFIELVEFGMKDVDRQITSKMKELQDKITSGLKALTGSYLSDIISRKYNDVRVESLDDLKQEAVDSILGRIDETVLSTKDKSSIRTMIAEVVPRTQLSAEQKIVAHFLFKLLELYTSQQKRERDVRHFVDVCNNYLVGKRLHFNSDSYKISVELADNLAGKLDSRDSIELPQLSSGEKQIVSLFSHLFLSGIQQFFVLIDEPELSLSVPWQKSFLVDILDTKRCSGLVAVSHSPFIFDNELDKSAHAIEEFWER